jgi:hypothetical protein
MVEFILTEDFVWLNLTEFKIDKILAFILTKNPAQQFVCFFVDFC